MLPVIFNSIFHQVCQGQADSGGINLRSYLPSIDQRQRNIRNLRDRPHPLHDSLGKSIDIRARDFKIDIGPVLLDQFQKIGNNLVFAVDLTVDVLQKFPVDSGIDILL